MALSAWRDFLANACDLKMEIVYERSDRWILVRRHNTASVSDVLYGLGLVTIEQRRLH